MRSVPDQLIDDLVREIAVIALSGNVLPPKFADGLVTPQMGYTAMQHKLCVESCQALLQKHDLMNWKVTTKQQ